MKVTPDNKFLDSRLAEIRQARAEAGIRERRYALLQAAAVIHAAFIAKNDADYLTAVHEAEALLAEIERREKDRDLL